VSFRARFRNGVNVVVRARVKAMVMDRFILGVALGLGLGYGWVSVEFKFGSSLWFG
jgi:hypothetical protein